MELDKMKKDILKKVEALELESNTNKDLASKIEKSFVIDDIENFSEDFKTHMHKLHKSYIERLNEALCEYEITGEIELLNYYDYLPNASTTHFIKNKAISINTKNDNMKVNKNIKVYENKNLETGQTEYNYIGKKENYTIIFESLNSLKSRQSITFRKTLNFILIKANEQNIPQNIYFNLKEYQEMTGYKNKDTAYKGAVRNFENLRGISVGGVIKKGKKEIRNKTSYIFTAKDISYNQCYIECKPEIVEMLSQYFTLLPKWAGELNTKAYDLLDYIFYMARQTQNISNIRKGNAFNVSLKSINDYIGGHEPQTTQRHAQLIIDPLLNAIEEIEETQRGEKLKITPIYKHNYTNAYDFLEGGYIKVELGEEASNYFCDRSKDREKKVDYTLKK